ncbi:hypothetical protein DNTS_025764 [Danionella cerebrum]|uniref:USP domain-containing protein n=1 Tax=Danionella cerebrum TaxID=2873325 RepID=A0A553NKU2_9TELE|nr:hypothetical protein DNTS_025764 [Danionella translucida]
MALSPVPLKERRSTTTAIFLLPFCEKAFFMKESPPKMSPPAFLLAFGHDGRTARAVFLTKTRLTVVSRLWQRHSSAIGNLSGSKMNGESTGIGALAPVLAGCLGKCEDKNASPGKCPWCSAKGQTNALRFYAISLKETILLCSSPKCLYPLVSRSLEDVRASLRKEGCKRKLSALEVGEASSPPKRVQEVAAEVDDISKGAENMNLYTKEQSVITNHTSFNAAEDRELPNDTHEVVCDQEDECVSSTQDELMEETSELVPVQPHLFWKNQDNLCWLDSMLALLVHCRTIRDTPCGNLRLSDEEAAEHCSDSEVWRFCSEYDKTYEVVKVPAAVLNEANRRLSELRMSIFKLLQPKLKCEIGQEETPVFALPLLLRADHWAEDLFKHTLRWEFKCTSCDYTVNDSVEKTLTTLTHLSNDWHPLKAFQRTQCNKCHRKNQKRKMVIEKLSSLFALHFVEGLSRKDLSKYAFEFQGVHYCVNTVIQYDNKLEHFVTWIRQSNGLWLELDDRKHPLAFKYKRFPFPAKQFHILFWEADSVKSEDAKDCLPTAHLENGNNELSHCLSDAIANDSCMIDALTVEDTLSASVLDASIGSTTLMDTFEGLSHKEIVTLTLVECGSSENPVSQTVKNSISPKALNSSTGQTMPPETLVNSESCENPHSSQSHLKPAKSRSSSNSSTTSVEGLPQEIMVESIPSKRPEVSKTSNIKVATQPNPPVASSLSNPSKPNVLKCNLPQRQTPSINGHPFQPTSIRPPPPRPRPIVLKCDGNEALPAKPAERFGGFLIKKSSNSSFVNPVCPKKSPEQPPISSTEALRLKLMKKLNAKKKKLAKLNNLLGNGVESAPKPDSTAISSPYSVSSSTSTFDNSEYDQFFAELLSPATSVTNHSPDSTGLVEMVGKGLNGETSVVNPQFPSTEATVIPDATVPYGSSANYSPLDEYIDSEMSLNAIDNTDFNSLDIFF